MSIEPRSPESTNELPSSGGALGRGSALSVRGMLEVLTVVALVVYGAVHFGDYTFYTRLGVSPDEVGLDYARTLGRVACGLVLLGAAVALLIAAGARLRAAGKDDSPRAWAALPVWFAALLVSQVLLATLLPPLPRWTLWIGALCMLGLGAALDAARHSGRLQEFVRSRDPIHFVALGALGLVVAFAATGIAGYRAAGYIRGGEDVPCGCSHVLGLNVSLPWVNGSRGLMGIDAHTAEVAWVDGRQDSQRPPLPERAVYLGAADGLVVLYDVDRKTSIRVPAQSIAFATEPEPFTWRGQDVTRR